MSVLDRKLRRELLAAKGTLTAVVTIIVLGISSFVMMWSLYRNLEQARKSYYARCRMADFQVSVKKVSLLELERLREVRGVSEYVPRIVFDVIVDLDDVQRPLSGMTISLPDRPEPTINGIVLRRGGYFTESRPAEVIVNDAFARARGIRPGDVIHLILNERRQELSVVGTAISAEFVYQFPPGGLAPDPENYGVFYLKRTFAEEVFDFEGAANQVVGLLTPEYRDRPELVLDEIETRLEPFGVAATTPLEEQPSHWFVSAEIEGLRANAIVLPGVFLAVAALVLNVLMTRMAQQQRTVVGTLKALGYSNRAVFLHFVKFGASVGVIGGLLGCGLGFLMAGGMTEIYTQFFEFPRLVNRPWPAIILAGVAISVLFAVLGSLRGVRTVTLLSPAEAMRPRPPKRGHRVLLERWTWLWRRLDFRWQMVLRSVLRNRGRTLTGVAAATLGAALLMVTFYSRDAMHEMLDFQFDKLLLSDFDLVLREDRDLSAAYEAELLPGVDYVEPVFTLPCEFHNGHHTKEGAVQGLVPHARLTVPRNVAGEEVPVPETGLLLTRKLADVLHVRPGEFVVVEPVTGERVPRRALVAQVVDSYLGLAAYADYDYLNDLVGESHAVSMLQVETKPGRRTRQEFYRELKRTPVLQAVTSVRSMKRQIEETLVDTTMVSIGVVILFAGAIFFGSVLNASLVSLSERRQEIATLRVMGYGPREVGVIFLRESLLVNLLGTLLGLPLGYWLARQFAVLYDTELFRLPFVIHPASYAATAAVGLVFTLLAHVPVQRAINRMDWLDALNVKE